MAPRWMRFLLFLTYAGRVLVVLWLGLLIAGVSLADDVTRTQDSDVQLSRVDTANGSFEAVGDVFAACQAVAPPGTADPGPVCNAYPIGTARLSVTDGTVHDEDRVIVVLAALPAALVLFYAFWLAGAVVRDVLTGDPFRPEVFDRARRLSWTLGLWGTLADFFGHLIVSSAAGSGFQLRVSFTWILVGMAVRLGAEVVRLGALRARVDA